MKTYLLLFFTFIGLMACQQDVEKIKAELLQTDSEFSALSKAKGMNEAFKTYLAEDGVMLRPNMNPVEGKTMIIQKLLSSSDTSFTLTWKPSFADASLSGDLGYTYGIYTISRKDEYGNAIEAHGTYLSIWKKDKEGKWKFVVDTGNAGIGVEDNSIR
jgi:ketosteroid isomerase-like protein